MNAMETLENVRKRLTDLSFKISDTRRFIETDMSIYGQWDSVTEKHAYDGIRNAEIEISEILTEIENAVGYWDVKE